MRKTLLAIALLFILPSISRADTTCATGTFQTYTAAGFTCTIGGVTLSNFSYSSSSVGATLLAPGDVAITPTATGLMFSAAFGSGMGQGQDEFVGFTITGAPITFVTFSITGGAITGAGNASVDETVCLGDTFDDGCFNGSIIGLSTFVNLSGVVPTQGVFFAQTTPVDIVEDINLFGGSQGSAFLTSTETDFASATVPTPEPGTLSLLGTGILALGYRRRFLQLRRRLIKS